MTRPEHDANAVGFDEIHGAAWALEQYSKCCQTYCAVGDRGGLEHSIRLAIDCLKRMASEYRALPEAAPIGRAVE